MFELTSAVESFFFLFPSIFRKSTSLNRRAVLFPPSRVGCLLPLDSSIGRGDRDDAQNAESWTGKEEQIAEREREREHSFCSQRLSSALLTSTSLLSKKKKDLEWKLTYVGSAESEKYDQVLDSVLVGPVFPGQYRFVFQVR